MSTLATPAVLEYYEDLARALPAPIPDKPEHRQRRLGTAIEAFQDLQPGNAFEGRLAVRIVLCGAQAVECMFEASIYREDFAKRSRCRAQANSFQREERAAMQILARKHTMAPSHQGSMNFVASCLCGESAGGLTVPRVQA